MVKRKKIRLRHGDVLLERMIEGLYPADDLYPSDDLYPADPMGTTEVSRSHYISCQYEDFICQHIDTLTRATCLSHGPMRRRTDHRIWKEH